MARYPDYTPPYEPEPMARTACRLPPAGGCVKFLRYWRATSNRLREFGPFERFIDRSKLVTSLTFDDTVAGKRYAVSLKIPLMGVVEAQRYDYQGQIYPFNGLACPTTAAVA